MEQNQVSLVILGKALHVHEPKEAKSCSQTSCQERYTRQVNQVSTSWGPIQSNKLLVKSVSFRVFCYTEVVSCNPVAQMLLPQTGITSVPKHLPSSPALLLQLLLCLGQFRLKSGDQHFLPGSGSSILFTQAGPQFLDLPLQLLPSTLSLG